MKFHFIISYSYYQTFDEQIIDETLDRQSFTGVTFNYRKLSARGHNILNQLIELNYIITKYDNTKR